MVSSPRVPSESEDGTHLVIDISSSPLKPSPHKAMMVSPVEVDDEAIEEDVSGQAEPMSPPQKKRKVSEDDVAKPKKMPVKKETKENKAFKTPTKKPAKSPAKEPKSLTKEPVAKKEKKSPAPKRRNSSQKFEQVEDALAAMFGEATETDATSTTETPNKVAKGVKSTATKTGAAAKTPNSASKSSKGGPKKSSTPAKTKAKDTPVSGKKTAKQANSTEAKPTPGSSSKKQGNNAVKTNQKAPPDSKKPSKLKEMKSPRQAQDQLLKQFQGPFVHVEGDPHKPSWTNVVNSSADDLSKKSPDRGIDLEEHRQRIEGGPTSTLDANYDAKNMDECWKCVFCHKGPHCRGMGDLFGPYFVSNSVLPSSPSKARKQDLAAKFIIGGDSKKGGGKKKKRGSAEAAGTSGKALDGTIAREDETEIWFHEDCICWLPVVRLIGTRLLGLDEAVTDTAAAYCSCCKLPGATLACVVESCRDVSHWPCALDTWHIDEEQLQAWCHLHVAKSKDAKA